MKPAAGRAPAGRFPPSVWLAATVAALSAFSFHAYVFALQGSWDGYFPMLHDDEATYCFLVARARQGRDHGDLYLADRPELPSIYEKTPARALAWVADVLGIPSPLLPPWSDLIATFLYVPLLYALFSLLRLDHEEALFLALATLILFPLVMIAQGPVRSFLVHRPFTSTLSLRLFVNTPNLFRFYAAQWTHLWFFGAVIGGLLLVRRPGLLPAAGVGLVAGLSIYIRVYDAMVLAAFLSLLVGYGLLRRKRTTARSAAMALGAFALAVLPYIYEHMQRADSPHLRHAFERNIIDVVGRTIDAKRLAVFLVGTAAAALLYRGFVCRRATPEEDVRWAFFLLLPASWLVYFHNVLLGLSLQRSHILWYHTFPLAMVVGLLCLLGGGRKVLPGAAMRAILHASSVGLCLFHLAYQLVPHARLADRFIMPPALRDALAAVDRHAGREKVVAATMNPTVMLIYVRGFSFLAHAPSSTALNEELLERYLLFKRLLLGPLFGPRVRDILREPIDARLHFRFYDASQVESPYHFDFPDAYPEGNQLYIFVGGYLRRFDLADYLGYAERYEPETLRRWRADPREGQYLSDAGRLLLERIAALPDDPDAIVAEIRRSYRIDLLWVRPIDVATMDPAWGERLRSAASLRTVYEGGGHTIFEVVM